MFSSCGFDAMGGGGGRWGCWRSSLEASLRVREIDNERMGVVGEEMAQFKGLALRANLDGLGRVCTAELELSQMPFSVKGSLYDKPNLLQ